jgi:hypothetical protein
VVSIVVLVGAGASYGAAGIFPRRPPLGYGLFAELCEAFPHTWGAMDASLAAVFEGTAVDKGFEAGMAAAWEQEWHPHEELWDLAVFFTRFVLNPNAPSAYDGLLQTLDRNGHLPDARFVSLNYETLLEQAMVRNGVQVRYIVGFTEMARSAGDLLKPHGSCNWLPVGQIYGSGNKFGASVADYEGPIRVASLSDVRKERGIGASFSPAMSLYAPGKHSPVAPGAITAARDAMHAAIEESDAILVVGACPRLVDEHVFKPLAEADAPVFFVGGDEAIDDFVAARDGRTFERLGRKFLPSLNQIDRALFGLAR